MREIYLTHIQGRGEQSLVTHSNTHSTHRRSLMSTTLTMQQFNEKLQLEKKDRLMEALTLMKTELKVEKISDTYKKVGHSLLDGGWR